MKKEPKIYNIATIAEIETIPEDKIDDFMIDLKQWLALRKAGKEMNDMLKALSPENMVQTPDSITWVDDGEHSVDLTITAKVKR